MSREPSEPEIQLPPHAPEDEASAIGLLIEQPRAGVDGFSEHLPEGSLALFDGRHRIIFDHIHESVGAGRPTDTASLTQRLRDAGVLSEAGGIEYLSELSQQATTPGLLQVHLQAIREKYIARRAIGIAHNLIESAGSSSEMEEVIETTITSLHGCRTSATSSFTGKDLALALARDIEDRIKHQGELTGIATGFTKFDRMISGLQPTEQTIIGARPSAGKSAIASNVCYHAAFVNQVPTLFISLEMGEKSFMRRMAAAHCRIPAFNMRDGRVTESEIKKLVTFGGTLARKPFFFHDGIRGMTSAQISSCIRTHLRKHGIKLVVIDYLQKIDPNSKHEKRTYEIGSVSKALVALARDTGIALLTLAQLNRGNVQDGIRAPRVSDLADSGQIDRDGDIICLLHKDPADESQVKFIIAKNRDGELGTIDLHFDAKYCQFSETVATDEERPTSNNYAPD